MSVIAKAKFICDRAEFMQSNGTWFWLVRYHEESSIRCACFQDSEDDAITSYAHQIMILLKFRVINH